MHAKYAVSIALSALFLFVAIALVIGFFSLMYQYGPQWIAPASGTTFPIFTLRLFEMPLASFVCAFVLLLYEHARGKFIGQTVISDVVFFAVAASAILPIFSWLTRIFFDTDQNQSTSSMNGVEILIEGELTFVGHLLNFHLYTMTIVALALSGLVYGLLRRAVHPTFVN